MLFRSDPVRLRQIIDQLLENAVRFTGHGSVSLSLRRRDDTIEFEVADTGPGIPPEQVSRLFERFWQAEETREQGSGLGLTIAKGIVEALGGNIWVESELGRGSTFLFSLPKAEPGIEKARSVS